MTAQHAFGGAGRAVRKKTGTYQIDEIIAYSLRTSGQGTDVRAINKSLYSQKRHKTSRVLPWKAGTI